MGDLREGQAALVDRQALELGRAVLGDDHVDLMARRGDDRPALDQGTIRDLTSPPISTVEGRQSRALRARAPGS